MHISLRQHELKLWCTIDVSLLFRTFFSECLLVNCRSASVNNSGLRLAGGSENRGRLEVYHNGEWRTVCDDAFSNADAAVFCRSMGTPYENAEAIASFGGGSGPIHMDEVNCDGQQFAMFCLNRGWGVNDCGHFEHVGSNCL
ncbi:hypothetical protein CAPTEDRAFT_110177 [Capitella teleta]|uniref:SRCR domain-containing protein n=1 Tax=Capitella teleta TaxID=283909 RepID=R7UJK1_CAPTE|nr:hypothetical protein CAPTEDRAFT_110177 [Capitella teleta]|eukprot:ELU03943.1 hypothetical protein CAPTEDRAFT_110177 [Capitella teleta]